MQLYNKLIRENYKNFIKFQIDLGIDFFSSAHKEMLKLDLNYFNSITTINELDNFIKTFHPNDRSFMIRHNSNINAKVMVIANNLNIAEKGDLPFAGQALSMFEKMFEAIDLPKSSMFVINFIIFNEKKKYLLSKNNYTNLIILKYIEIIKPDFLVDMCINNQIDFKINKLEKKIQLVNLVNPEKLINNQGLKRTAWENLKQLREMINAN